MKVGVLLTAFGSSHPPSKLALEAFEERVRELFPALPIRWAFTSVLVRKRLAVEGEKSDSVNKALEKMWFERFTHIAVQSLHMVAGREFEDLVQIATAMTPEAAPPEAVTQGTRLFERLVIGKPLLSDPSDFNRAAQALARYAKAERANGEAVVFMGHGTKHQADKAYGRLAFTLAGLDRAAFIGTMEGRPKLDEVIAKCKARSLDKATLLPLLSVIGRHAQRDMAGDGESSWKSRLLKAGIEPRPQLKAAVECPGLAAIWLDHLRDAVAELHTTPNPK